MSSDDPGSRPKTPHNLPIDSLKLPHGTSARRQRLMIEFYRASLAENVQKLEARQSEITRQVQDGYIGTMTKRSYYNILGYILGLCWDNKKWKVR